MKTFKYILVLGITIMTMACDRSDDSNYDVELPDRPTFDETTVYGKRMKEFHLRGTPVSKKQRESIFVFLTQTICGFQII